MDAIGMMWLIAAEGAAVGGVFGSGMATGMMPASAAAHAGLRLQVMFSRAGW
jgi:hypothetical protein